MSRKWDYCTPSEFSANLDETQQEPVVEAQVANGNENSAPSRPNHGGQKTALYKQTDCKCKKIMNKTSTSDMVSERISQHICYDSLNGVIKASFDSFYSGLQKR